MKRFLNISNHPSGLWSKEQVTEALSFGKVVDLPFPVISDEGDESYIQAMVTDYMDKVKELCPDAQESTIHVMGEMTFTYALVNALRQAGYRCVASTTKRIVEILPDGTKKSQFAFSRFREYR